MSAQLITSAFARAIAEQQSHAWELRALLQVLDEMSTEEHRIEDLPSCLRNLARQANELAGGLTFEALQERAAELAREEAESALEQPDLEAGETRQ